MRISFGGFRTSRISGYVKQKTFFLITSDFEEKVKILFSILDMHNTEASDNWLQRVHQLVSLFSRFWTILSLGIDTIN